MRKYVALLLCVALLPPVSSCGTILYPERQHARHSGQIDIAVLLMDGVGLLFFIIPGVVAFAVDFHTGAIYLPKGHPNVRKHRRAEHDANPIKVIQVDRDALSDDTLAAIVNRETGLSIRLDDPSLLVRKAKEGESVETVFQGLTSTDIKVAMPFSRESGF